MKLTEESWLFLCVCVFRTEKLVEIPVYFPSCDVLISSITTQVLHHRLNDTFNQVCRSVSVNEVKVWLALALCCLH